MDLSQLEKLSDPVPLSALTSAQLLELQKALNFLGFPAGDFDGMLGPKTRNAWAEFRTDVQGGNPNVIGPESVQLLAKDTQLSAYDFSTKLKTVNAIKAECVKRGIGLKTQIAYVLATVQWETNATFRPVREAYWEDEAWRERELSYFPYYGRGYVQLTWKFNYDYYGHLVDADFVNKPDSALQPNFAAFILVHGFKTGKFTGRSITDFIDSRHTDFLNARRCINGTDRAHEIADLANRFLNGTITIE